eukprot:TRINITY_DN8201_c0_g1_i1.p1 TRINITY_DN8201_c0_g1~~TRINITY_DN8201_c0_g1_i1.p1  ORF type:complete len:274 (-),score=61.55 TRINITY_DN8201_c0_g1_i1:254-1075(-)
MTEESTLSVEELEKNLTDYKAQLDLVNGALRDDPESEEFLALRKQLIDALKMTKDLLLLKKEAQAPRYENIQEIAATRGIYIGMQCEALWSDGKWYKAVLNNMTVQGFGVTFTEYNTNEIVPPDSVRHRKKLDVVVLESGQSQKSKETPSIVVNTKGELIVPNSLKILPTDSETVRKNKKKRLKRLKSSYRLQKAEEERNTRKQSWQSFQSQGKTKRARKGPSIFQSPDSVSGKVGVTGSGKGMTEYVAQKYEPKKLASTLPITTVKKTSESY